MEESRSDHDVVLPQMGNANGNVSFLESAYSRAWEILAFSAGPAWSRWDEVVGLPCLEADKMKETLKVHMEAVELLTRESIDAVNDSVGPGSSCTNAGSS